MEHKSDELYMRRCFDLARLGAGQVSPNPMVGAVLVHNGRIIGEGWHQKYGEAHAEVNCLRSVAPENRAFIPHSTLYCSLEPCFHHGKTPPCVDLILQHKIPALVVANTDPNPLVSGKGLEKLKAAGVTVTSVVLEEEGLWLNRFFFSWITRKKTCVILKWAQSLDGFLGKTGERTPISEAASIRLVHKWRSETDAILVGTNTAVIDNPRLDTRFYFGKKPLRIVFDTHGKIPSDYHLLDDSVETWVYGPKRPGKFIKTQFFPQENQSVAIPSMLDNLAKNNRATLMVEGGARVLQQFLDGNEWDEIRLLQNSRRLGSGIPAPSLPANAVPVTSFYIGNDRVEIFRRSTTC